MEHVSPTRMNLLAKRGQIKLARQGAELLNRKKDALLRVFFDLVAEAYAVRAALAENLRRETLAALAAEAVVGREAIVSAAATVAPDWTVRLSERNLWGVRVLDVQTTYRPGDAVSPRCSPRSTALAVDEVAAGFQRIVADMLELAPREVLLERIGDDIRRTNRKINALEQQFLPRLEAQARQIAQTLEERARDDVLRLKRLKNKKARGGA